MSDAPLIAHSLAEVHLYLLATPCPSCGRGPLHGGVTKSGEPSAGDFIVGITARCEACQRMTPWKFRLPGPPEEDSVGHVPVVNASDEPSRILDVGQWLTLFSLESEASGRKLNKTAARMLAIEAAQCLDEALKFYEEDNDLPPADAFFHEGSRERFRDHPHHFSRQRLLHLRSKQPTPWPLRPDSG